MRKIIAFLFYVILASPFYSFADSPETIVPTDTTKIPEESVYIGKKPLKNFNIDGSYQAYIYFRDFNTLFDGQQAQQKLVVGNSDGGEYRNLRINFSGRPTIKTYFKTDLYIAPGMRGFGYNTTTDKLGIEIGVNMEGQINTDHGDMYFKFGGTQFTKLSKLTLWSTENKGESMFERSPWGGFQEAGKNYESYYSQGTISRDFTWGNKFLQGFSADFTKLPHNLESKILFAKTPDNGGQTSYLSAIPNMSYGAMVRKRFASNYIGVNNFNAIKYEDAFNDKTIGYNIISSDFTYNFWENDLTLSGELGKCRYIDVSTYDVTWADAFDATLISREKLISIPITLHYFYIAPKFINLQAGFNSFLKDASTTYNGEGGASNPVGANMSDLDYINGNRKGGDIRTEFTFEGLKINLAYGLSQEVEHLTNVFSYNHRVNNLMFSRVYAYQKDLGKSGSLNTTYQGYYETSSIDTTNPAYLNTAINFTGIECNLKYKINVFNKPLFMFYLASISSTQGEIAFIPLKNDDTYMVIDYQEFEAYYKIFPKIALASYLGIERMKGGTMTYLGKEMEIIDEEGVSKGFYKGNNTNVLAKGIGLGIDYEIDNVANLYVRGRWFNYTDHRNSFYQYSGFEGTVELRVYF